MRWFKRKVTYKSWKAYKQDMNSKEDILFMHTVAKQSVKNLGGETCGTMPIDTSYPYEDKSHKIEQERMIKMKNQGEVYNER